MSAFEHLAKIWQSDDRLSGRNESGVRLDALARQLGEIIAATEEEFLALGTLLGKFHLQARQAARRTELPAGSLPEEVVGDLGNRLKSLLCRLEHYREEQERICAAERRVIHEIRLQMESLEEPLSSFRQIVKTLLTLGVAIRIESSGGESGGAVPLADELKELATLIGARSTLVRDRLAGLEGNCMHAWNRLDEMQAGQGDLSRKLLQEAGQAFDRLVAGTRAATREAGRISSSAARFAREIEEVVASIQFQDIVRQKVEHIRRALVDAETEASAAGEICRLQAGHLRLAHEEMRQAGRRIVQNLNSLAGRIDAAASPSGTDPASAGVGQTETVFGTTEKGLAELTLLLQEGVIARQQSAEAIAAVRDSVELMGSLLGEISLLGEKMKVVALNAAIRAVHGGAEGAALAVIANAIQQLAAEALLQTRSLEDGFRRIMHRAGSLDREEVEETPAGLCAEASALLSRLQGVSSDLSSGVRQAATAALALAEEIRQAAGQLKSHETFAEQAQAIENLLRQQNERHGRRKEGEGSAVFQEIYSRYTMQSEREVHRGQLPGTKVIDLEQHRAARRGSELGDNVELF